MKWRAPSRAHSARTSGTSPSSRTQLSCGYSSATIAVSVCSSISIDSRGGVYVVIAATRQPGFGAMYTGRCIRASATHGMIHTAMR